MKTIRLLYPDFAGGGLETYWFGAHLLAHILPPNEAQPLVRVDIDPPDGSAETITDGIHAKDQILRGIRDAAQKIRAANPDRIITIGGNCLVSQAPFDYLHGKYERTGIIWIDAHPDVSTPADGYPNAHAMVLASLLGCGDASLTSLREHPPFGPEDILYVGLQELHAYQRAFLDDHGVPYRVQTSGFVTDSEIAAFMARFDHLLVHLDIDVLDERLFHSTYFANPALTGDGSGGGKMTMEHLAGILHRITEEADVVGFTIAEYLPFDAHRLRTLFAGLNLFTRPA